MNTAYIEYLALVFCITAHALIVIHQLNRMEQKINALIVFQSHAMPMRGQSNE